MDCSICCEKFNNSNHLKVECKGCDTSDAACRQCCKTYILNSNSDPMCMFCKSPWERDFMIKNLTKKFVDTDLKKFSENLFLERQISLLPDTQKDAMKEKKIRGIQKMINDVLAEKARLKKLLKEQDEIYKAYCVELSRVQFGTSTEDTAAENFTMKCCSKDCNGFLNSKYYCTMCETKYCKSCMEVKTQGHVCNEDTKATIQAIKKQSKPCPGCGEMISKIDGCDQMWCVKCHIQFSWRTGQKMEGYNHNPEYFRWLRETGQTIERNPYENRNMVNVCGVNVDGHYMIRVTSNLFPTDTKMQTSFINMYRFYRHVEFSVGNFEGRKRHFERCLLRQRIMYLLGDITKEKWKNEIQKLDKQDKKNTAYENVWRLVLTVLTSMIEKFIVYTNEQKNPNHYKELMKESHEFRKYANESFMKISNTFGSQTCPGISIVWQELGNLKSLLKKKPGIQGELIYV